MKFKKNYFLNNKRGFTLIELLVVVAIIGLLSTVVFTNLNNARAKSRDSMRKSQMRQIQSALELYLNSNGSYPSTGGLWYSSESGDNVSNNNGDWIPGLAPTYIPALPKDPKGGMSLVHPVGRSIVCGSPWMSAYLYKSDGSNYKLLSNCAPEGTITCNDVFCDPQRWSYSWMITNKNDPMPGGICSGDTTNYPICW